VGIATKLVDVPGHIFLLADTGVHERNRVGLGLGEELTVVDGGRVWIPLESTAIGKGFLEAWRQGAEAYAAWAARGRIQLVDVEDAFERYEPAELPSADIRPPTLNAEDIQSRVGADLETVAHWREATLAALLGASTVSGTPSLDAQLEIARVQFMAGKLDEARSALEGALGRHMGDAAILSNLGTVLAAQADLEGAARRYQEALSADDADGGVWLNLGLVRYALGDTTGAQEPLARGIEKSGGYAQACALLAIAPDPTLSREGGRAMTEAEARVLLENALRKVPRSQPTTAKSKAPAAAGKSPGARAATPAWRSRVAGGRSADLSALQQHLYWKER
jgi:tetratricopeptide (TPR) repeat protein